MSEHIGGVESFAFSKTFDETGPEKLQGTPKKSECCPAFSVLDDILLKLLLEIPKQVFMQLRFAKGFED